MTDAYGCVGIQELVTLVVDSFPQPVVTAPTVCGAKPVTISLTNTTGTVRWYDAAKGGKMVGTGNTFTTPANTKSTSYYYEQSTIDTLHLGPVDTTIGIGYYEKSDYGENGSYMLVFEAAKPFLLKSFKIYSSQNTGDKTFSFFDYSAQNINTTVPMNLGEKRINVNWWVKPGSNYSISSIHSQMYTNTTGVTFPYTNSLASITQSWGGTTAENSTQYLFYYDWIMVSDGCIAPRVKVEAIIDTPTVASFTISADTLQWPKTTVSVINTSTNATTSQWDFGDNSMDNSPIHKYTNTGTFNISLKTTNGICNSLATKTATIIGDVSKQTINLTKGWNILSTGRFPLDSTVKTIFAGLDVIEVKTMDAFWRTGLPEVFNSLKTIEVGKGYLVKMNTAGSLVIYGSTFNKTLKIYESNGKWQLIGCPTTNATPFSQYYNQNNCSIIKNFDGFWNPTGSTNSLNTFELGQGYFIK
ncbi:MAG: PKD domain-containing protein [Bacteroidales bacterium]|nr:PKD domain-containing protein [Bacteroidales bacterium]